MGATMLELVAHAYRTQGPLTQDVPVRTFLDTMSRAEVEDQLGMLLETGTLVARPGGAVALAVGVRASMVSKPVLTEWVRQAQGSPTELRELLRASIRAELRELVRYCLSAAESAGLRPRAIELLSVLAMSDLDPNAIDVVAGLGGTQRSQLEDLAAVPEGSCRSLKELQVRMRRFVTTTFLGS